MINYSSCNGVVNINDHGKRMTIVNDKEYPWLENMNGHSITTINDKTFIDGYELKNGKWKRTLRALFHLIF